MASKDGLSGDALTCVRGERLVFAELDFVVGPGELLLLRGPNGSGKSSLLRVMAGLLRPAAGQVAWDGADIRDDIEAHGRRLRYVGHLDAVKPILSVAENLSFWARLAGSDARGASARVEDALVCFGIERLANVPGRFLSAGQRRRLILAQLVAAAAPLWLLDEPTVGLDQGALAALRDLVGKHRASGGIVVAATHDAPLAEDCRVLEVAGFATKRPAAVPA